MTPTITLKDLTPEQKKAIAQELKEEEKHLIIQILLDLTAQIAEYKPNLEEYQTFLEYKNSNYNYAYYFWL